MQFKQSLLLSASELQSIVADKDANLKKMCDFETQCIKIEKER